MTTRLVVSDTSPIRVLSHLSQLSLLGKFFDEVLIPPAVAQELESPPSHTAPIALATVPKCRVEAPKDVVATKELEAELQTGEAEAIVLAHELAAELLIDEAGGSPSCQAARDYLFGRHRGCSCEPSRLV